VQELTQPQGHSTSGSHERYKSPERLQWEKEMDCIKKFEEWIIKNDIATPEEIEVIKNEAVEFTKNGKDNAWKAYSEKAKVDSAKLKTIFNNLPQDSKTETILHLERELTTTPFLTFSEVLALGRKLQIQLQRLSIKQIPELDQFIEVSKQKGASRYHTNLYSETKYSALNIQIVPPKFGLEPEIVNGYQVLNTYFDQLLQFKPNILAFGEDVGQIGDVNQGFAGLQQKHGLERVFDTGIREWTIMGQAMGGAMRGLRPIAEIQYLDYMAYAFSLLSDDLATLRYRTNGIQRSPAIIRTRGHRLEGIWHAGSPMGMILTSMQGIYLCVPRNMVQAVGFYKTSYKFT
jgi:hypothetical protein